MFFLLRKKTSYYNIRKSYSLKKIGFVRFFLRLITQFLKFFASQKKAKLDNKKNFLTFSQFFFFNVFFLLRKKTKYYNIRKSYSL